MNKVTILLLKGTKVDKTRQTSHFVHFLLLKDRENLLKQGLEFGTVLAI